VILTFLALAAAQISTDPLGPTAPDPAVAARLGACSALVRTAPQQALDDANAWLSARGGLPARQCAGLAYVALQQWAAAATVYEQAAQDAEAANLAARADFRVQAGNAWLAAGEAQRALQALDAALATPGIAPALRGGALLDRARAQVALGRAPAARADIDQALQLVPADPLAWYLSAALARRETNATRAATDIARAQTLGADNPDILLLAGTIAGEAGNMEEAERLYRRVVALAPDSDSGREAQASLATMREVEVPTPAAPAPAPVTPPSQSR
jgi:tetratricopeptide (TPR) repeat protein